MAEGGGDDNEGAWWNTEQAFSGEDQPDSVVTEQIGNESRVLLTHFIGARIRREENTDVDEQQFFAPNTPTGTEVVGPEYAIIGNSLQTIGDQLDNDTRVQSLICDLPANCPHTSFLNVARAIFSDGKFNWGRVVMLFYLAFKLAKKALNDLPIIQRVIEWVIEFIKKYVASWIFSRGGWSAIQEYFSSTTTQAVGVFALGVISAFLVYKKYR